MEDIPSFTNDTLGLALIDLSVIVHLPWSTQRHLNEKSSSMETSSKNTSESTGRDEAIRLAEEERTLRTASVARINPIPLALPKSMSVVARVST